MKTKRIFATFALLALSACLEKEKDPPDLTGGSVVENEIAGTIRYADGSPAAGATVKVYEVAYAPGQVDPAKRSASGDGPVFSTRTDAKGRYVLDSLSKGEYNILAQRDDQYAYQDSVFLTGKPQAIDADTLDDAGSATGVVALQPNHSLETVTLQALGTNVFANADADGKFKLTPLAAGRYTVRVSTTENGYTALYASIVARAGVDAVIQDTLRPTFTGIPVVTGLTGSYDTLASVVTLRWNKASYSRFLEYEVLRGRAGDPVFSAVIIGSTRDTVFRDSLGRVGGAGPLSGGLGFQSRFSYRVRILDQSERPGLTFGRIEVDAPPPDVLRPEISLSVEYHPTGTLLRNGKTTQGDSLRINVRFRSQFRAIRRLRWIPQGGYGERRTVEFGHATMEDGASLFHLTGTPGPEKYNVEIEDETGKAWVAAIGWQVMEDLPWINIPKDITVARGDSVWLKADARDELGRIVKWEWDVGGTGIFRPASGPDTAFAAPLELGTVIWKLRVTDEDGNKVENHTRLRIEIAWTNMNSKFIAGFTGHVESPAIEHFQGKLWLLGGLHAGAPRVKGVPAPLAVSDDGITWGPVMGAKSFPSRYGHKSVLYQNKVWVMGGRSADGMDELRDVWYSSNGLDWERATEKGFPCREGTSVLAFRDKLWCLGGNAGTLDSSAAWFSTDGANWTRTQSGKPFPYLTGHASVVHGDRVFLVGGSNAIRKSLNESIWASTDGTEWLELGVNTIGGTTSGKLLSDGNRILFISGNLQSFRDVDDYDGKNKREMWSSKDGLQWDFVGRGSMPAFEDEDPEKDPIAPYGGCVVFFQGTFWSMFGREGGGTWSTVWRMR